MGSFSLLSIRDKASCDDGSSQKMDYFHLASFWSLGSSVSKSSESENDKTAMASQEELSQPDKADDDDDNNNNNNDKSKVLADKRSLSCRMMAAWYCSDDDDDDDDSGNDDLEVTTKGEDDNQEEKEEKSSETVSAVKRLRPPSIVLCKEPVRMLRAPSMVVNESNL